MLDSTHQVIAGLHSNFIAHKLALMGYKKE